MRYKILIQYDGGDFCGWQVQPDAVSIQETIEEVLARFLQEPIRIIGSGRTDTGVHALGQVAHFDTEKPVDLYKFIRASNGLLPPSIRILEIEEVDENFHAQYSAKGKIYHYHLWFDEVISPFVKRYRTHYRKRVDLELLQAASQDFLGTHNFSSFANQQFEGSAGKNPIRTITRISVIPQEGGVRIEFEGNGFLYKMVRNMVGMLLEIASGERPREDITKALALADRTFAGKAAPASGLFLAKVFYPPAASK